MDIEYKAVSSVTCMERGVSNSDSLPSRLGRGAPVAAYQIQRRDFLGYRLGPPSETISV